MNNILKVVSTLHSKLSQLKIENGQLIFVEDTHEIFLDLHDMRTQYGSFIFLNTEEQRLILSNPLEGFYFVYETNILWRYAASEGWIQITSPGQERVVFMDEEDFPAEGNSSSLYISGLDIYRWQDNQYKKMSNPNWEIL